MPRTKKDVEAARLGVFAAPGSLPTQLNCGNSGLDEEVLMKKIIQALLALFLFQTSVQAADKIRISIANLSGQFMAMPLAHKKGFLKEEGIDAEIIRVTGGASAAALSSGDLDYGTGMTLGGSMTGLPVKVVACFVPAPVFALVARPEIKTVQELKGKTVGISTFGGLSIFGARVIVKHFGLEPDKDIKFVALGAVEGRFIRLPGLG